MTTAKAAQPGMSSSELLGRLRRHYLKPGPFPGGMFAHEVGQNGPGAGVRTSRCDAIYVGFTSTSGRLMVGHELKVSRSDWLAELRQPGKADAWADECQAWYVVAPSIEVVHPAELPPGWGLLVPGPSKTAMQRKVRAAEHPDRVPAWWATRSFLARVDTLREQEVTQRVDASVKAQLAQALAAERSMAEHRVGRVEALARELAAELSGAPSYHSAEAIVAGVRDYLAGKASIEHLRTQARWAQDYLTTASKALAELLKEPPA